MIARDVFGIGKINYESFFFNLVISPLIFLLGLFIFNYAINYSKKTGKAYTY